MQAGSHWGACFCAFKDWQTDRACTRSDLACALQQSLLISAPQAVLWVGTEASWMSCMLSLLCCEHRAAMKTELHPPSLKSDHDLCPA